MATTSEEQFKIAQEGVTEIALKSGNALETTAELYYKLSGAVKQTGGNQQDTLAITEAVTNAVRLSGVTAATASNGIIQFAQGLAAGTLQGQDLRAVIEDIPALGQAIAESLGITTGQLRKLAEEGALTPNVVLSALEKAAPRLAEQANIMTLTIGKALENLKTTVIETVGEIDKSSDASVGLIAAINGISSAISGLQQSGAIKDTFGAIGQAISFLVSDVKLGTDLMSGYFDAFAAVVNEAASLIVRALSLITFGDLSKEFSAAADDLETRAIEFQKKFGVNMQKAAEDGSDAFAHFGGVASKSIDVLADLASESEQSADKQGKANKQVGDTYLQAAANAKAYSQTLLNDLSPSARKLVDAFIATEDAAKKASVGIGAAHSSAKKAEPDFKALFASLKPESAQSVDDVVSSMDKLREMGRITAQEYETGLQKLVKDIAAKDLPAFVESAEAAFSGSAEDADKLKDVLDTVREDSLAKLGINAKEVLTGVSDATNDVIARIVALGENTTTTSAEMSAALAVAIPKLETSEGAEALKTAIAGVTVEGFNAAAAVKSISDRANELPSAAEKFSPLNQAYKELGITSAATLQRTATAAQDAFKALQDAKAPVGDLDRAFAAMAAKQLEAAAAQGDTQLAVQAYALKGQAATEAEATALDALIAKYPSLGSAADDASKKQVKGAKDVSEALAQSADDQGVVYDSLFSKIYKGYAQINDQAVALFDHMLRNISQVGLPAEMFMERYSKVVGQLDILFAQQKQTAEGLTEALSGNNRELEQTIAQAQAAAGSLQYLDKQTLDNLNSAIDSAKSRLQSLNESAQQTFESLQDQLDQLNSNDKAVQQRQNDRKAADIKAQIQQAASLGDTAAVQTLQKSLSLLQQINKIQTDQAKQQKGQSVPASAATPPTTSSSPPRLVDLSFLVNGNTYTGAFEQSNADGFINDLAHAKSISTSG